MPTKNYGGRNRPFIRTVPEPLETWLPKQEMGIPTLTGEELRKGSIGENAYYDIRYYQIRKQTVFEFAEVGKGWNWFIEKIGIITALDRAAYRLAMHQMRTLIGQSGLQSHCFITGGVAVRGVVLVDYPDDLAPKDKDWLLKAIGHDARVNFEGRGRTHQEGVYYA